MTTWDEFLEAVRKAESELGNPPELWYRGQSDHSWELTPSLMRRPKWEDLEEPLFNEFQQLTEEMFPKRSSDFQVLFDMQHYGVPTRLLDWTTALGAGVAFVLLGEDQESAKQTGALYVLDPAALNRLSGRSAVIDLRNDSSLDYKTCYWRHEPQKMERPMALLPSERNERMKAQSGVFTIHGVPDRGFEAEAKDAYRKIPLPPTAKAGAREFLKWANYNAFTIYPDIVGMADYIKAKYLQKAP